MKQSIDEAAYCYATNKTEFRRDILKEVDSDNYVTRHSDCMNDFLAGVHWQQEQSSWISVEERFPENNSIVLVTNGSGFDIFRYLNGKFYITVEGGYNFSMDNVTHWMAIPEFNEK